MMAASRQDLLRQAWLEGREGNLTALSEARAWALREVWREDDKPDYGMLTTIAKKVTKVGGGHPSHTAISKLFDRIDDDQTGFLANPIKRSMAPIL